MGPTIFNGDRTKLLTSKGIRLSDGSQIDNDGALNYIKYGHGEFTTGWSTFNDATSFADGTGGSPTATWTASATTPLRGSKSFLFTAGGAGDGVSYAFTIDSADKAKVLSIEFDYEVVTFASMTDNDFEIWIYDVTNAVAIQPVGYQLKNNSLPGTHYAEFQTSSNSTSYRLSIYQKDGTTSNIKFDNIRVGPNVNIQPEIGYIEGQFTPVLNASTTSPTVTYVNQLGFYTKTGRVVNFNIYITYSAISGGSGNVTITGLPFTSNATSNFYQNQDTYYSNLDITTNYNSIRATVVPNTTRIEFYEIGDAITSSALPLANIGGGTFNKLISVRGFYII